MRVTVIASLMLCGCFCTGCGSLNKTALFPGKKPAMPEQLANDLNRRAATEKQVAQKTGDTLAEKAVQQTNFTPAPTEMDPILLQAKQAEQAQQNQIAKALYEQVLQKQPQHAEAHHRLGVLADQEGRYPEAQQHYQMAVQQDPQNASLLSDIGYSYFSQDRLDEAEKSLNQALQLQPGNQTARNNLGHVYGRRAQQTGSATDYQLAEQQFMLALGPQGAETQMKQLFPQGGGALEESSDKRGILNPFKSKRTEKGLVRGGGLLAPKPKEDGNEKLLREMKEIRDKMESAGELPKGSGSMSSTGNGRQNPYGVVPPNQLNDAISNIDREAEYARREALQRGYPDRADRMSQGPQGGWNDDRIQQVGGRTDPREVSRSPIDQAQYAGRNTPDWNDPASAQRGGNNGYGQPNAPDFAGQNAFPGGYPADGSQANWNGAGRAGDFNGPQNGRGPGFDNSQAGPAQNGAQDAVNYTPSWPDNSGSPTQFNAQGNRFNGNGVLSNSQQNTRDSGLNGQDNPADPAYWTATGQMMGPQRPNGGNRSNPNAWNEGRQAAAQLGLDAGMGEMFPGNDGDMNTNRVNQAGYPPTGPRNGAQSGFNWNTDASIPTTQRGLPQGGNGMMSPADYSYGSPNFQNTGYSQGVNPTMGDNYGQQGNDVSAPWNQSPTMPRSGRNMPQMPNGSDAGGASGRFAPGRPSGNPQSQNFGAPPMYYGR